MTEFSLSNLFSVGVGQISLWGAFVKYEIVHVESTCLKSQPDTVNPIANYPNMIQPKVIKNKYEGIKLSETFE